MDAVRQDLGDELIMKLNDEQINTVETFLLLTQDMVMRDLGLKLGSWLRIDRAQQALRSEGCSTTPLQDSTNKKRHTMDEDIQISPSEIKGILESELSCQKLLYGKLAEGRALQKNEKNLICRTICPKVFNSAMKTGRKITLNEKQKLAKAIVEAFDCLKCDTPGKPVEAEFFWKCNGEDKGSHTGFIQNWIRNYKSKSNPAKRIRQQKLKLSDEEVKACEELCATEFTPELYPRVMQLLTTTFRYRQSIRASDKSSSEILSEFPCLLDEDAIHQEFELMFPNQQNATSFESIIPLCLMLKHEFDEIANDGIRALAKISSELTQQGARKSDPEDLPPIEDFLSVFVRWRQEDKNLDYFLTNLVDTAPYVFCDTFSFAEGVYYAIINVLKTR
ncbi:uncharacterized protein LOC134222221 [Armigeres subalbatus]|uniref:uncharacterized protein LOC134222221 n=1 Tax=Armigeres subalbatus TaxID=124917 RepID=UPI002ED66E13